MDTNIIQLIAPIAAKFATDFVKNFVLTKLPVWAIQLTAVVLGTLGSWLIQLTTNTSLPIWQTILIGTGAIVVNEVGNTIKGK